MTDLKPGRELDALVAEKVMELSGFLRTDFEVFYHKSISENKSLKMSVPFYSTDMAAAWTIVEALQSKGVWTVEKLESGWFTILGDFSSKSISSAPHSICLAALKAVGYKGS